MVNKTYMGHPIDGARQQLRKWAAKFGYDADAAIAEFDLAVQQGIRPAEALAIIHIKYVMHY